MRWFPAHARPESIWEDLLPEVALILAVYCESKSADNNSEAIDTLIPEITSHVSRIERYAKLASDPVLLEEGMTEEDAEISKVGYEFVLGCLLRIAMVLDYGDEVGRRNMFGFLSGLPRSEGKPNLDRLRVRRC